MSHTSHERLLFVTANLQSCLKRVEAMGEKPEMFQYSDREGRDRFFNSMKSQGEFLRLMAEMLEEIAKDQIRSTR